MMKKILLLLLSIFTLAACSNTKETSPSYDEIKKIVIDSIQTEEGKKAMRQLLQEPDFRELVVLEHDEVRKATEETLLSKEAEDFWKKTFEDPKFQETIAKSMQKQQQQILKSLMKDPGYQEDLTAFFGQPDMQKQLGDVMKSAVMRKEMEKIVQQTIENPLLEAKWQKMIRESGTTTDNKQKDNKANQQSNTGQ